MILVPSSTPLTPEQLADWKEYVLKCFPNEACAFIVNDEIYPVPNTAANPRETFSVDPVERIKAEAQGHISGFLHSHPATPEEAAHRKWPTFWPSSHDMVSWLADNLRWGISACDGENVTEPVWLDESYVAPLEGRPFVHGIWDCYSAVRDYFRVNKGITLKNYPRGMEWWAKGEDLYSTQFTNAGFVEVRSDEVQPGDCALMHIVSRGVVSHAVVMHDMNTMFHHTFSRNGERLSGYEDFGRWRDHVVKFVRYVGTISKATPPEKNNNEVAENLRPRRARKPRK